MWLHDLKTLAPLRQLPVATMFSPAMSWSPDGTRLAIYLGPTVGVGIYHANNPRNHVVLHTDDAFDANMFTLAWSPDGQQIGVLGTGDWRIWNPDTGRLLQVFSERAMWPENITHDFRLLSALMVWSPDSTRLAVPDNADVAIYNTQTWERELTLPTMLYRIVSLDWSFNNELAVVAQSEPIQIWDMASNDQVMTIRPTRVSAIGRWSPTGDRLAFSESFSVTLVDRSGQVLQTLQPDTEPYSDLVIADIQWEPQGRYLVTRTFGGCISTWDTQTGERIAYWEEPLENRP